LVLCFLVGREQEHVGIIGASDSAQWFGAVLLVIQGATDASNVVCDTMFRISADYAVARCPSVTRR